MKYLILIGIIFLIIFFGNIFLKSIIGRKKDKVKISDGKVNEDAPDEGGKTVSSITNKESKDAKTEENIKSDIDNYNKSGRSFFNRLRKRNKNQ